MRFPTSAVSAARAVNAACYMGFITSPDPDTPLTDERNATTGEAVTEMAPGLIQRLNPGENFASYTPTRPNAAFDGFLRAVLREIAGAVGTSYESLSRDYSQSNYSSSRLALLDDRDLWRVLQSWWIRAFRAPLHRLWMRQAVYARAVPVPIDEYVANPEKFEAARFKPRGWSWVDPTKEVAAYKEAVKAGFCTVADVIAATNGGQDLEDVLKARRQELDLMADLDLQFDTDPALEQQITAPAAPAAAAETGNDGEDATDTTTTSGEPGDEPARVYALRG
jgi:lambda family phage portal protein